MESKAKGKGGAAAIESSSPMKAIDAGSSKGGAASAEEVEKQNGEV